MINNDTIKLVKIEIEEVPVRYINPHYFKAKPKRLTPMSMVDIEIMPVEMEETWTKEQYNLEAFGFGNEYIERYYIKEGQLKAVEAIFQKFIELERKRILEEFAHRVRELDDYLEHKNDCILLTWSAGKPTSDGKYLQKFGGRWYEARPKDKTPKCDCGLDQQRKALDKLIKEYEKDNT